MFRSNDQIILVSDLRETNITRSLLAKRKLLKDSAEPSSASSNLDLLTESVLSDNEFNDNNEDDILILRTTDVSNNSTIECNNILELNEVDTVNYLRNADVHVVLEGDNLNEHINEDVIANDHINIADVDEMDNINFNMPPSVPPFRGAYSDNAVIWLQNFELWLNTLRNLTERARISHFALQMRDAAKTWVNQFQIVDPPGDGAGDLPPNNIHAFADIRLRFLERFRRPDEVRWQDVSALYERKQGPLETTEHYVNEMLKCGESANAADEHVRFAVLHGLRDNIKNVVLQHDNADLQQIVRWGVTAEMISDSAGSEIKTVVEKLENMMSKLQVSPMVSSENETYFNQYPAQAAHYQNSSSMTPNFNFRRNENFGPPFQTYIFRGRGRGKNFTPRSSSQQGGQRTFLPQGQNFTQGSNYAHFIPQQEYQQQFLPQRYQQWSENLTCSKCGSSHGPGQCRAYGQRFHG